MAAIAVAIVASATNDAPHRMEGAAPSAPQHLEGAAPSAPLRA
jgi:hypothetical protein